MGAYNKIGVERIIFNIPTSRAIAWFYATAIECTHKAMFATADPLGEVFLAADWVLVAAGRVTACTEFERLIGRTWRGGGSGKKSCGGDCWTIGWRAQIWARGCTRDNNCIESGIDWILWHWVGLANGARQPPDVFGLAATTWACTTQEDGWGHCTVNWTFTLPLLESFSTMKAFP